MAYYAANVAGNWSAITTWVTSSIGTGSIASWVAATSTPGASDYVFLNNKLVTLDASATNINVTQINTLLSASNLPLTPGPNVLAGGSLLCSQTTHIITASSGIYQGNAAGNLISASVLSGTINITASTFDCSAQTNAVSGVNITVNTVVLNIIADTLKTGTSTTGPLIGNTAGNSANITIKGSTIANAAPLFTHAGSNPTLTITGSVTNTSTNNAIQGTGGATINISGSIICQSSGQGINHTGTSPITIIGDVSAGPGTPAIVCTSTALVNINGNIFNNGPIAGVVAQRLLFNPTSPNGIRIQNTDGVTNTWQAQGAVSYPGLPSATDVRFAVTFGPSSTSGQVVIPSTNDVRFGVLVNTGSATGLMIVPSASDVRYGVLVNTGSATGSMYVPLASQVKQGVSVNTGSATGSYVGPADIWSYATASLTTGVGKLIKDNLDVNVGSVSSSIMSELNKSGSSYAVVTRLQNTATVGTTGDQISSFNT